MGIVRKVKSRIEMWRLDRYTKRRSCQFPGYEYRDGDMAPHFKDILKNREKAIKCSETYNMSWPYVGAKTNCQIFTRVPTPQRDAKNILFLGLFFVSSFKLIPIEHYMRCKSALLSFNNTCILLRLKPTKLGLRMHLLVDIYQRRGNDCTDGLGLPMDPVWGALTTLDWHVRWRRTLIINLLCASSCLILGNHKLWATIAMRSATIDNLFLRKAV